MATDIIADFFEPSLGLAKRYFRIAGYFNSGMLAACARGMSDFIVGNGHMKLICSPHLSEYDLARLRDTQAKQPDQSIFDNALQRALDEFDSLESIIETNHVEAMAWMLRENRLELKIAVPNSAEAHDGLFHQKRGVLEDQNGDILSFSGSINETYAGWTKNVENFKVFRSWVPGQAEFVSEDKKAFTNYWTGDRRYSHTAIEFPEALRKGLVRHAPPDISRIDLKVPAVRSKAAGKTQRPLRDYQVAAVKDWIKSGYRGIFEMATGAGKTLTAAHCVDEFFAREARGLVVVTAPYQHIANQWLEDLSHLNPVAIWKAPNWRGELDSTLRSLKARLTDQAVFISVQNTAASSDFVSFIERASQEVPCLLVGDEAHALGARKMSKSLSSAYEYRLALTATPTRYFDEDGSEYLKTFFGGTVYKFTLEEALTTNDEMGMPVLCPYIYKPIFFHLSAEELQKYRKLSFEIKLLSAKKDAESKERARLKTLERSRVIKKSEGKIPEFRAILQSLESRKRLVVYCENKSQIEAAAQVMDNFGIRYARFSGEESSTANSKLGGKSERQSILEAFSSDRLDALVAMKCLDEGVNIPSAETAIILASSGNEKEYIQRRGRMMRQSPATGKRYATIFDLVAVPDFRENNSSPTNDEAVIMAKELQRLRKFGRSALNSAEIEPMIFRLMRSLNLPFRFGGDEGEKV